MGTRGLVGIRWTDPKKGEKWNGCYNHLDSYPSYLGQHVVDFASKLTPEQIETMKKNAQKIVWIKNESKKPSLNQLKKLQKVEFDIGCENLKQLQGLGINSGMECDWYWTLRDTQGVETLEWILKGIPYLIEYKGFLKSSLFCEYAYILDLDRQVLEFYEGYQREYGPKKKDSHQDERGFYTYGECKKVGEKLINDLDDWKSLYQANDD